ncbi:MAG: hypothetical protein Q9163_004125 [Psora crenata]
MGFPYRFLSLDEDQNRRRRYLLDNYGQFAQLSILLLPLIYQLTVGIRLLLFRSLLQWKAGYQLVKDDHPSPVASRRVKGNAAVPSTWTWRRIAWILDEEIVPGWGTRWEWLMTGCWTAWLLLLVIKDTSDDYLHLTKRFGIVAASQLPIHYLLAAKAWSPVQYLTRMSYEALNPYHRLLGRIIVFFFACHAILYLNFYVQKGLLSKRIRDWDVFLGLCAFGIAWLLFTTTLARIRNYNYRIFFYTHVVLSASLLPILFLHVSHLRIYVLEAAAAYALIILQRNLSQVATRAEITRIPETNLLSINIPLTNSLRSKRYSPGQHIYLGFPPLPQKLRINPFTIANDPSTDGTIQLVARSLKGTTAMLETLASQLQAATVLIEGPYGSAKYLPDLATYDRILLIAGGVGATFTIPLLCRLRDSGGTTTHVKFVWAVKEIADARWGIRTLKNRNAAYLEGCWELYVTGSRPARLVRGAQTKDRAEGQEESMELGERCASRDEEDKGERIDSKKGRPDLRRIVDEVFEYDPTDRVAILVCGPKGMGAVVRKQVGKWVASGRDVLWHSEDFVW